LSISAHLGQTAPAIKRLVALNMIISE